MANVYVGKLSMAELYRLHCEVGDQLWETRPTNRVRELIKSSCFLRRKREATASRENVAPRFAMLGQQNSGK